MAADKPPLPRRSRRRRAGATAATALFAAAAAAVVPVASAATAQGAELKKACQGQPSCTGLADPAVVPGGFVDDDGPTKQPASRGQDQQRCGYILLPERLQLTPKSYGIFTRTGEWETWDGATLVSWVQDLFFFNYDTLKYWVDNKFFIRVRPLVDYDAERLLDKWGVKLPHYEAKSGESDSIYVIQDCEGLPLYYVRQITPVGFAARVVGTIEIFNHFGQLVCRGAHGEMLPDQIYFRDELNIPIAMAQSPMITPEEPESPLPSATKELYGVDSWQIWWPNGYNSQSGLREAQSRYVIAAVIQQLAVSASMRNRFGGVRVPVAVNWFALICVAVLGVILWMCSLVCCGIFRIVYPPKHMPVDNPFLKDETIYRTVAAPRGYDRRRLDRRPASAWWV